jgi:uncharacterized coiled-coil protein SlyX
MGHNPSNRDAKPGTRNVIEEKRTPEEIIKAIRGNLTAHLSITPSDIAFLLAQYDSLNRLLVDASSSLAIQDDVIAALQSKVDELQSKIEYLAATIVTMDAELNRVHEMSQDNGEEFPDHGGEA